MKTSRRELFVNMVIHRDIYKITKLRSSLFTLFIPEKEVSFYWDEFPKAGVSSLLFRKCDLQNLRWIMVSRTIFDGMGKIAGEHDIDTCHNEFPVNNHGRSVPHAASKPGQCGPYYTACFMDHKRTNIVRVSGRINAGAPIKRRASLSGGQQLQTILYLHAADSSPH